MNKLTFNNNNKKDFLRSHTTQLFGLWYFLWREGKKFSGRKRDKMEEEIRRKNIQAKDMTKEKIIS